jgi:hypothetical protein
MSVNLVTKYAPQVEKKFTLDSVVMGKAKGKYSWDGARTVKAIIPTTQSLTDYDATASANRFGTPAELQDTLATYEVAKNRSFSIVIDKENNTSQMMVKAAGDMMKYEVEDVMIPEFDAHCLKKWVTGAGQYHTNSSLTKSNIVQEFADCMAALINQKTPTNNLTAWVGASNVALLLQAPEFVNIDSLGKDATRKGIIGEVHGCNIIRVPDSYLPTGVNFLMANPKALLAPVKIKTLRILTDAQGFDGAVLEGRMLYDAFVVKAKENGVIRSITSSYSV